MRFTLILVFILNIVIETSAQIKQQHNFIIEINEDLVSAGISRLRITSLDIITKEKKSYKASYYPGLLTTDFDLHSLFGENIKVSLVFYYYSQYINNYYEIELKRDWITSPYLILSIYDLSCRKYRKYYSPLSKDQKYTFEFDTQNYSMRRARKKLNLVERIF